MKFLLDMGLPVSTAAFLRQLGHDCVHLREQALQRLGDDKIIEKAVAESRVLVTFDLDFPRILSLARLTRPSVILFRLEHFTAPHLNSILADLISARAVDLDAGVIVVIDQDRIRTRRLPIV